MLADDIEAGGGSDEAVARALGWHRRLMLEEVAPGDCDRDEHVSYMEVPWWRGPSGERKQYLPPSFLTDLNALAAECERRKFDWWKDHRAGGLMIGLFASAERPVFNAWAKTDGTAKGDARALCAALVRAVEAGNE